MSMGACYVTARIRAFSGKGEALQKIMLRNIPLVRKEEGCLRYELLRAPDNPDLLMFNETWRDRKALEAHLSTPHMLRYREETAPLIEERKLYIWEPVDCGEK